MTPTVHTWPPEMKVLLRGEAKGFTEKAVVFDFALGESRAEFEANRAAARGGQETPQATEPFRGGVPGR